MPRNYMLHAPSGVGSYGNVSGLDSPSVADCAPVWYTGSETISRILVPKFYNNMHMRWHSFLI